MKKSASIAGLKVQRSDDCLLLFAGHASADPTKGHVHGLMAQSGANHLVPQTRPVCEGVVGNLEELLRHCLVCKDHAELAHDDHVHAVQLHLQRHVKLNLVATTSEVNWCIWRRSRGCQRTDREDAGEGGGAAQVTEIPSLAIGTTDEDLVLRIPELPPRTAEHHSQSLNSSGVDGIHLDKPLLRSQLEGVPCPHNGSTPVVNKGCLLFFGDPRVLFFTGQRSLGLMELRADQVIPGLLPLAGGAVDNLPDALQLREIWHRSIHGEPTLTPHPSLYDWLVLLVDPEAMQQADQVLGSLVGICVPPLYQVQDL
mmetsp:Transcript_6148/g.13991  ORF Transcript_6148/g.13991 Transcript_6148/m.13991 type:complete len:312 (-) Transcript_6148:922-1857(-)